MLMIWIKRKKELDDAKKQYEETLDWYNYTANFALVKPKEKSDNDKKINNKRRSRK